jgi:hypothetical protein
MTLKRVASIATLALVVGTGETRALPLPVTTARTIAGPAPTEQVWWGGGAFAAGLVFGGLIGAAVAAPYYAYPAYGYAYPAAYPVYYRPYAYYAPVYHRPYAYRPAFYGYRHAYARPYRAYRRAYFRPYYARPYRVAYRRARYW